MNKTKIEWTDYTWNPIKGVCPVGCWYCYARRMYKRFKREEKLYYLINGTWNQLEKLKKPSRIFICSTIELFHPKIKPYWRDQIFREIEKNPRHTFQILTKLPQNIDRIIPRNVWIGVTVEGNNQFWRAEKLWQKVRQPFIKNFISFEPFFEPIHLDNLRKIQFFDWIIIGRLTQHGHKYDPKLYDILQIRNATKIFKIPIFLKDNLKEIWGDENLIQEFPKEKKC